MAFFRSIDLSHLPTLGEKPNQPKSFLFPKRSYGKTKITNRAFQQNGLRDGDGFTMTALVTERFVSCALQH